MRSRRPRDSRREWSRLVPRGRVFLSAVLALTAALLTVRAVVPAPANAADLFPVDDWLGAGIKKAGDVALGPLRLGAKEIARLLATIVGALADLLVPKSLVRAGLGGIRWLVELPPVGVNAAPQQGVPELRMPHLTQLRDVMTWIGITLLPLGLTVTAARAFLAPTAEGESPADVFGRVITAGVGLLAYDWAWGVVTELSRLLTSALLGLPWVADGVQTMLETLLIGGASGTAVASEFVVPLLIMVAGTVLLGLLLVRVGLEVATALLYVLGGLVLGLSVTGFGRRLLSAWLIAATAIVLLPLLWAALFATGAALMLDAGATGGHGGFGTFVAQLYNVAAALAVFWLAIKLALGVFRHASGAITAITSAPLADGASVAAATRGGPARLQALAQNATPAGLARFSRSLRGGVGTGMRAGADAMGGALSYPMRHPVRTAQTASYPLRRPMQATREAAGRLSGALIGGRAAAARAAQGAQAAGGRAAEGAAGWYRQERDGGRFSRRAADARANGGYPSSSAQAQRGGPAPRASSGTVAPRPRSDSTAGARVAATQTTGDGAPRPAAADDHGGARPSATKQSGPRLGERRVAAGPLPAWWRRALRRTGEDAQGRGGRER